MHKYIANKHPKDKDYAERSWRLGIYKAMLESRFYDVQQHPFHQERKGSDNSGDYIYLRDRRPSVQYNLCKTVVRDSAAILFGADHFPSVTTDDKDVQTWIRAAIQAVHLPFTMVDAVIKGSVGSVVLLLKVLGKADNPGRFFLEALDTVYLTPTFDPDEPDVLVSLRERYKVSVDDLQNQGYVEDDVDADGTDSKGWEFSTTQYWVQREWTLQEEVHYRPLKHRADKPIDQRTFTRNTEKSLRHGLGFVPALWIKNLPGGRNPDGMCTFEDVVDDQVEIDYQLSQVGRGLKYSQDPTLVLKDVDDTQGEVVKGEGAILVGPEGDAKLLEINGRSSGAVLEYVEHLRKYFLEVAHGSRIDPDRSSVPQSGKSMELLNLSLIELAGSLRLSYGEALRKILVMMCRMAKKKKVKVQGGAKLPDGVDPDEVELTFIWPPWYPPMAVDRFQDAQAIATLKQVNAISTKAAVEYAATEYGVADPEEELHRVEVEKKEDQTHEMNLKEGSRVGKPGNGLNKQHVN